jgi:hypothetical protein
MKERITRGLLALVAVLLTAHLLCWSSPRARAWTGLDGVAPVLRAHEIQLVSRDGGNLRLRSAEDEVRVKLGAARDGSALLLLDQDTEPGLRLATDNGQTRITLASRGRTPQVLQP